MVIVTVYVVMVVIMRVVMVVAMIVRVVVIMRMIVIVLVVLTHSTRGIPVMDFMDGRLRRDNWPRLSKQVGRVVGLLTAGAMYLLDMPTPLLWGVIAAVLGLVPYVGPLIVATIIGCAAMVTFDTWTAMLMPVLA